MIIMDQAVETQVEMCIGSANWGASALEAMDTLRQVGFRCDVSLIVKDGSIVPAHSVVLAAGSPFFKQVLQRPKLVASGHVMFKCTYSRDVMQNICDFLYRGRVTLHLRDVSDVQRAARTFGLDALVSLCQVFVSQGMNLDLGGTEVELPLEQFQLPDEQIGRTAMEEQQKQVGLSVVSQAASIPLSPEVEPAEASSALTAVTPTDRSAGQMAERVVTPHSSPSSTSGGGVAKECDVRTSNRKVYRYQCDLCDRIFTSRARLRGHRATHTGDRLHKCNECDATFIQMEYLREHIKCKHMSERPYKCKECGLTFRILRHLKKHERVHSQNKTLLCTFCGSAFRRRDGLINHMRVHTDEKPFVCAVCGWSFRRSESLKRHSITHSTERHYHCSQCKQSFRRRDNLKNHEMRHRQESQHPCPQPDCSSSFRLKRQLQRHTRVTHKKEAEGATVEGASPPSNDGSSKVEVKTDDVDEATVTGEEKSPDTKRIRMTPSELKQVHVHVHVLEPISGDQDTQKATLTAGHIQADAGVNTETKILAEGESMTEIGVNENEEVTEMVVSSATDI